VSALAKECFDVSGSMLRGFATMPDHDEKKEKLMTTGCAPT
jgi:hypothetical protein